MTAQQEPMAEEKLKEEALFEEYKEAVAYGSTNMDFRTWCWAKEPSNNIATIKLGTYRPNR